MFVYSAANQINISQLCAQIVQKAVAAIYRASMAGDSGFDAAAIAALQQAICCTSFIAAEVMVPRADARQQTYGQRQPQKKQRRKTTRRAAKPDTQELRNKSGAFRPRPWVHVGPLKSPLASW